MILFTGQIYESIIYQELIGMILPCHRQQAAFKRDIRCRSVGEQLAADLELTA